MTPFFCPHDSSCRIRPCEDCGARLPECQLERSPAWRHELVCAVCSARIASTCAGCGKCRELVASAAPGEAYCESCCFQLAAFVAGRAA